MTGVFGSSAGRWPAERVGIRPVALAAWWFVALAWAMPTFHYEWWTPRFAALAALLPVGLACLAAGVRARHPASIAGSCFLLWVFVGALASSDPLLALKGVVGRDYSALMMLAAVAAWAVGAATTQRDLRLVTPVATVALMVNSLIATVQVTIGIETGMLASAPDRASGALVNPVYLGAIGAGFVAFGAVDRSRWGVTAGSAGVYVALLSGSRVAFAAALLAVLVATLLERSGSSRFALPYALSAGLAVVVQRIGDTALATGRLGNGSSGRLDLWRLALEQAGDRPLLGTGIGLFRNAVQPHYPVDFVLDYTALGRHPWADPHNILVLLLISTGVVGLVLFVGFVALAVRGARGPYLAFSGVVASTWLLQPASIMTLPLAMFALGAASSTLVAAGRATADERHGARRGVLAVSLALLISVSVIDLNFSLALGSTNAAHVESARLFFVRDAAVEAAVARWYSEQGETAESREHVALVAEYESNRPINWVALGRVQQAAGEHALARTSFERAIELQPTELGAWLGLVQVADEIGDEALGAEASERACELIPSCE